MSSTSLRLRTEQEKDQLADLLLTWFKKQIDQELEQQTVSLLAMSEEQMEQEYPAY